MLRFIHCADLHFDRPFEGLHLIANKVKELRSANEQVLEKIVSLALEEQVDFLLLAGDTFHQNRPSLKTQHQFFQQMNRLKEKKIPVYLIFGNHDFYEQERYWFDFPENVQLFTEEQVRTLQGETQTGVSYAISGFSYRHPWIKQSMVKEFPARQATYHIGMYHGDSNGENYAPFKVAEMQQKNYDYWALGHVHVPTVLKQQPPILYPGAPQGHTQKEEQIHGVQLVTWNGTQTLVESRSVAVIDWVEKKLSLAGVRTAKEALTQMMQSFQTSHSQLVKLLLTNTENLPNQWLTEKEKPEIIAYLNEYLQRQNYQQLVYQIELYETPEAEKLTITGREVAQQLLQNYQEATVFTEIVEEMTTHPLIKRSIQIENLQKETVKRVEETLTQEFRWSEEER